MLRSLSSLAAGSRLALARQCLGLKKSLRRSTTAVIVLVIF
jgi:hypothetical protein